MPKDPADALPVLVPPLDRRRFLQALSCAAGCAALSPLLKGCTVVELYGGSGSDVTFDLAAAPYDVLTDVGAMVPVETGARKLLLIRLSETEMIALDRICTHVGCDMLPGGNGLWDTEAKQLVCVCHGSVFDPDGAVVTGPATRALATYPVDFDVAAGTGTIRVTGDPAPGDPIVIEPVDGAFTLAFDTPGAEALAEVNGMVAVDAGERKVLLIRTAADTVIALDRICTHQDCDLAPNLAGSFADGKLLCNCHFSEFATDGSVVTGPAMAPLQVFTVTQSADSVTVQLT